MNKTLVNAQNSTEHYSNFSAQWLKLRVTELILLGYNLRLIKAGQVVEDNLASIK